MMEDGKIILKGEIENLKVFEICEREKETLWIYIVGLLVLVVLIALILIRHQFLGLFS